MTYDSAPESALAQRYFIQALALAQAGENRLLGASVLDAMSHQATYAGHYAKQPTWPGPRWWAPAALLRPASARIFTPWKRGPWPDSATHEPVTRSQARVQRPNGHGTGGRQRPPSVPRDHQGRGHDERDLYPEEGSQVRMHAMRIPASA
jgi:hypothetical protein